MQVSPSAAASAAPCPASGIAAHALACRRGDRVLLRGIALALEPGAALHLAGVNGIGKSSLLRVLAGLATPAAGTLHVTGSVGLLDGRAALDPELPLARALAFWAKVDRADPETGEAALVRLGLDALREVPVGYLSTGQTRRAAFVRLLAQRAAIWLLDEPLNGLDTASADLAQALVSEHCARGGIAVIASHQPFDVPGLARLDLARHVPGHVSEDAE
ncbi:heme ABC exporter ATP-binding protein CcmA [Novosphingobium sp. 9]|uniref:heme ABC exporter ATP-binding protein CcmA n=1 Tax=Novosphingobium sp. 9 TaxID=2025349 RepID=UPI0021B6793F|nr:heme ABC exporter ATP-binding protein CcmA [Novosphingobium sp. 9]